MPMILSGLAGSVLLGLASAGAAERVPVPDARPLLLAALRAPDGQAHGRLSGELAEAIGRRFQSGSPIFIDVTTAHRYIQPGCGRLNVTFWQDGVLLPGAAQPQRQTIEFGINYCLDGSPPKSLEIRP
ncbi:hypothetical protein FZ025_18060 [Xanthomonas hyacinthi]|uniref:Uncharacterized protein n=3 Tax=Xanthomonas hyacinthi TaxID=56455 RepID=A0A2S7F1Z4_9XANT|nr:hypothetical protein XhyaCFBP1156_04100 [Xanthomonas hyacinthi]QGY78449.1 hypothetical protein FZ025_18060 [Xanthomonas hyacinthi]